MLRCSLVSFVYSRLCRTPSNTAATHCICCLCLLLVFSLMFFFFQSGINATCPAPDPKANLTLCNNERQVCLQGVSFRVLVCATE